MAENTTEKILKEKKEAILRLWIAKQEAEANYFSDRELEQDTEDFAEAFVQALDLQGLANPSGRAFERVYDVLTAVSVSRAKRGFTPRETAIYLFSFKEALLEVLAAEVSDASLLYAESLRISKIIDNMAILTFEGFIKGREEIITRQTDEITEISTPVIQVWDGVVALPIIGTLDSARTQVVMENLLQQIVDTGSSIAILDISGVPAVDTLVAQHLIKTVSATRLLGAECIISGIRPEIAQIIVHLGIDLTNVITKSTLASALQTAFNMLQVEVVKKRTNPSIR